MSTTTRIRLLAGTVLGAAAAIAAFALTTTTSTPGYDTSVAVGETTDDNGPWRDPGPWGNVGTDGGPWDSDGGPWDSDGVSWT